MLAVELQGHGRTGSGDRAASFEGSADGVAALLKELSVGPVDVLGFSNGGQVGMQLAIRHLRAVRRLIVASAPFRRDGMVDGFWHGMAEIPGRFDGPSLLWSTSWTSRKSPHGAERGASSITVRGLGERLIDGRAVSRSWTLAG